MTSAAIPMPRTLEPFTRAPRAEATPGWCLRFLSGEMKGRTVILKRGPNVLGSAGDCEVMLPGRGVLPRHLVFTVGEVALTVQRVGTARACLNGQELATQRRSVVAGDVVSVGPIDVQLDRNYPQAAPAGTTQEWPESILPGDAALPEPAPPQAASRSGYWVGGGAALLLVLAALLGVALLAGRPGASAGGGAATLAELQKVVAGYPEVEVLAGPGGGYVLKGFVETPQRKQALQQAMARHGRQVAVQVQTADEMVEQARRYIAAPGVTVAYAGRGRLVVSGTVEDESVRLRIRRLADDLQPTVAVSDKLEVRAPLIDRHAEQEKLWASWQGLLPARMVSITEDGNGLRYIQLANGNRLYEGSLLRSGAELTRIENDRLVVTRQGAVRPKEGP